MNAVRNVILLALFLYARRLDFDFVPGTPKNNGQAGKADSGLANSPVAGGCAFHKCSVGGGAYFDTKKRLWRGKGKREGLRPTEFKSTLMAVHFVGRFQTPF